MDEQLVCVLEDLYVFAFVKIDSMLICLFVNCFLVFAILRYMLLPIDKISRIEDFAVMVMLFIDFSLLQMERIEFLNIG